MLSPGLLESRFAPFCRGQTDREGARVGLYQDDAGV